MHDVHRDSLIAKGKKRKVKKSGPVHSHDEQAPSPVDDHGHEHGEKDHRTHSHDAHAHDHENEQADPHGHSHDHDEDAYGEHDHDLHTHDHGEKDRKRAEDRAFAHLHEHGHDFFHAHHHTHHSEHAGVVHKVFGDPVRDWFGAVLMGLLIVAGYFKWLPGHLSDGMLVCAAVIGLFPLVKNGLFDSIYKRTLRFELLVGILLLAGLFMGRFLEVALIALLLLMGSFMRLNFSWKD